MSIFQKLFGFKGRLRRRDWWLLGLVLLIVSFGLAEVGMAMLGGSVTPFLLGAKLQYFNENAWLYYRLLVQLGVSLILLWPMLAVGVKRLHDRNRTGWWLVPFIVLGWIQQVWRMVVLRGAADGLGTPQTGLAGLLLVGSIVVLGLWLLVELALLDGTRGPNRFGESPKPLADSSPLPQGADAV